MTANVFEAALGIGAPWSVGAVGFDEVAKVLTVLVDFKTGTHFKVSCWRRFKIEPSIFVHERLRLPSFLFMMARRKRLHPYIRTSNAVFTAVPDGFRWLAPLSVGRTFEVPRNFRVMPTTV